MTTAPNTESLIEARIETAEKIVKAALKIYGEMADNEFFGHHSEWRFEVVEQQERSYLGACYYYEKLIRIDKSHLKHGTWETIKDTCLHEAAHALAGFEISKAGRVMHHGARWKSWARRLGANPKSTTTASHETVMERGKKSKYYIVSINDDNIQVHGTANRRHKNLACKYYRNNAEQTRNKLWHIRTEDYLSHKSNPDVIRELAFR